MSNDKVWEDDDGGVRVDFSGTRQTTRNIGNRSGLTEYADIDLASGYHKDLIWTTKDGRRIAIPNMSDSHLLNTIAFLRRRVMNFKRQIAIAAMHQLSMTINMFDDVQDDWIDTAYDRFQRNAKELFDMHDEDFLVKYLPIYQKLYQEAYKRKILIEVDRSKLDVAIKKLNSEDQVLGDPKDTTNLGRRYNKKKPGLSPKASSHTGQPVRDAVETLADAARSYDGVEVEREDWNIAEEVVKRWPEEFSLGSARGPNGNWKRLYLIGENPW